MRDPRDPVTRAIVAQLDELARSMGKKICRRCGVAKPFGEFYAQPTTRDRLQSWCKACQKNRTTPRYRLERIRRTRDPESLTPRDRQFLRDAVLARLPAELRAYALTCAGHRELEDPAT